MGLIAEFKDFIVKGNAIDLAVGIIIGAAFGGLVKSLVDDVMMPPIGFIMGGVDFSDLSIKLQDAKKAGETLANGMVAKKDMDAVVIGYGKFINALIGLVIQGFCIFLVVKAINKMKRAPAPSPAAPPPTPEDVLLLREIRDSLKK
jgi:large conductance mechanosensitive channel